MKTTIYAIAGLAALGIMIALIASPPSPSAVAPEAAATSVSATPEIRSEAGTLTLEVPSMHCQFACYPAVKATLEKTAGVSVALAEQPDPNALTVKKVIVTYDAGYDLTAALSSLKQQGFDDAMLVQ